MGKSNKNVIFGGINIIILSTSKVCCLFLALFTDSSDNFNTIIDTALIQFVVDNGTGATRSSGETGVKSVWFSGQQSVVSTALFVGTDWVWNTWASSDWVEVTTFALMSVISVVFWVGGDTWLESGSDVSDKSHSESSFDDAGVDGAVSDSVGCSVLVLGYAFSFNISLGAEKVVRFVINRLSTAVIHTGGFGSISIHL